MQEGDAVAYVDERGRRHHALVTCMFGGTGEAASVNVVYVSPEAKDQDQYGRQMRRETSVVHASRQGAHGCYWEAW